MAEALKSGCLFFFFLAVQLSTLNFPLRNVEQQRCLSIEEG